MTRSAYAVGSQRIRLRDNQTGNKFFSNIYITAGAGNGNYKPLEKTFIDHTEKLKDVGCATYDIVPKSPCSEERAKRAIRTGGDYGQIYPIGSVAIEIYSGLHSIWEWDGRNPMLDSVGAHSQSWDSSSHQCSIALSKTANMEDAL